MNEKGCVFELSTEFRSWEDFIYSMAGDRISKDLLPRITKQILNVAVEYCLDTKLANPFAQGLVLEDMVVKIIEDAGNFTLNRKALTYMDDVIFNCKRDIISRLEEMFHTVDMRYALWSTKQLSNVVSLIEYQGDFRVMEWHQQNGIPCDTGVEVSYDFSLQFLYKLLDNLLVPHRGRYAKGYFTKCLDLLVRNIVEEIIFLDNNKSEAIPVGILGHLGHLDLNDLSYSRKIFTSEFPLMSTGDVSAILSNVEQVVNSELSKIIEATLSGDSILKWYISEQVLTITVDRVPTKLDFTARIKDDIKFSIINGDYVPQKLRNMVDL